MADAPPPGLDIHEDQGDRIISSNIALIILPTVFVLARLASRKVSRAGYWWDDTWVVLALVLSWGPPICSIISQHSYGFGKHIWVLGPPDVVSYNNVRIFFFFQLCYVLATSAVKVCILTFYRRIFHVRELRTLLYICAAVVFAYFITSLLLTIFQCTPVHYYWSRSRGGTGHCVDGDTVLIGLGIVNCITDALIVTLPLPLLWRLRTTRAQKALLTGIFVTTGFVCVISVIRLVVLSRLTVYDLSWVYVSAAIWSAAEPCMGVIAACLPSLRPLISLLIRGTVHGLGISRTCGTGTSSNFKMHPSNDNNNTQHPTHPLPWSKRKRLSLSNTDGTGFARLDDGFSSADGGVGVGMVEGNEGQEREEERRGWGDGVREKGWRWGHDVDVKGGRGSGSGNGRGRGVGVDDGDGGECGGDVEEVGEGEIRVRDEVIVSISSAGWMEYKDRVF